MIYQTGTITTTAGQTKIKGTGTRWKDNLAGISEGCPISYLINNVVYMNTVLSVNSDTEINLTYPVPVAAAAAKYQIATFVLDSMSDGVRKMLANQQYIQYFLRNMDTWLTQDGIVEIKTPTGETVRLESIIALKKLIDGKFDKKGGEVDGAVKATGLVSGIGLTAFKDGASIELNFDGESPRIVTKNKNGGYRAQTFQDKAGVLMHVGDSGVGSEVSFHPAPANSAGWPFGGNGGAFMLSSPTSAQYQAKLCWTKGGTFRLAGRTTGGQGQEGEYAEFYSNKNTTKDANGNLKAASPIIKVFASHIELNDESEGVTLKKLHTGIYQLHGVLGLHSDASWGGIHGGITIPCGINQMPLVYALYDVLEKGEPHPFDGRIVEPDEDGDIVLYTTYRKHDLPQNIQYERFKLYPEFLKEVDGEMVELTPGEPCDIPNGHWIDVRVNMPSDSIYNQKLAEAERLAKLEAERLAEEEAKRAAEEAERAEQEATERKQYDLGDNDTLL
ncbi:hypothetical protein [Providencia alcalifaciens]|uniref:phage tail fiber protein n=1 Tax=Providencia alcalifaciens TaxID=126385 RepID=UPI002AA0B619|nr:hypothetical protein [Providencia alcalifaciens]